MQAQTPLQGQLRILSNTDHGRGEEYDTVVSNTDQLQV